MIERFKLITHGKAAEASDINKLRLFLTAKMKCPASAADKILAGQAATLVKNIEWEMVNKLHQHFKKLGLKTSIILQPNAQCFTAGLVDRPKKIVTPQATPTDNTPHWLQFNLQQLRPNIFSPRRETTVLDNSDAEIYTIKNHRFRWNALALLIFSIYCSLKIEHCCPVKA